MTALLFLIPLSLAMATAAFIGFLWSVGDGQLDDLSSAASNMLIEDSTYQRSKDQSGGDQ